MKTSSKNQRQYYKLYLKKIKVFYQQPNVKASLNLGLTLVLISFLTLFLIKPTSATIIDLTKELKEKKEVSQKLEQKIISLNKAEINYGQFIKDIDCLDRSLPEQADFKRLAGSLNYLAFQRQLTLDSAFFSGFELKPSDLKERKLIKGDILTESIIFNLTLKGKFNDLKVFLADLENLDRLIKIKNLGLSSNSSNSEAIIEVNIEAETYWLSGDKEEIIPITEEAETMEIGVEE